MSDTEVKLWLNYCLYSKMKAVLTTFPKLLNKLTKKQRVKFSDQIKACQERLQRYFE